MKQVEHDQKLEQSRKPASQCGDVDDGCVARVQSGPFSCGDGLTGVSFTTSVLHTFAT